MAFIAFFFFPKEIISGPGRATVNPMILDFMVLTPKKVSFYSFQGYAKGMRSTFSPDFHSCAPFNAKAFTSLLLPWSTSTPSFVSQVWYHVSVGKLDVGSQTWKNWKLFLIVPALPCAFHACLLPVPPRSPVSCHLPALLSTALVWLVPPQTVLQDTCLSGFAVKTM